MKSLLQLAYSARIVQERIVHIGGAIVAGRSISCLHVLLNYLVPYHMASYSAEER